MNTVRLFYYFGGRKYWNLKEKWQQRKNTYAQNQEEKLQFIGWNQTLENRATELVEVGEVVWTDREAGSRAKVEKTAKG